MWKKYISEKCTFHYLRICNLSKTRNNRNRQKSEQGQPHFVFYLYIPYDCLECCKFYYSAFRVHRKQKKTKTNTQENDVWNCIYQNQLGSPKRVLNEIQMYVAIKQNDSWQRNHVLRIDRRAFILFGLLTRLLLDKLTTISQTIFLDVFSWMKSVALWLKFHWSLFLKVHLTITQYWFI